MSDRIQTDSIQDDPIRAFRAQFCRPKSTERSAPLLTHMNNAGLSPIPRTSREIVEYWIRRFHEEGVHCNDDYMAAVEVARRDLAEFLGAKPSYIAFFQSTAGGISQFAFGMDLAVGDEVVMWDQEYASNMYPWKAACDRAGAKLVLAQSGPNYETPFEALEKVVTERTRVIAVSWVQYQTGAITDLERLSAFARPRGILTVIDIIQGAGVLPFNFENSGIDAVCGGSHKWMCSPVGVGYLCLREELAMRLKPLMIGALTYGTCEDKADLCSSPKRDALRFEAGSKQVLEITALGTSAKLLGTTGIERIAQEAEWLARKLLHGIRERGYPISTPHGAHQRGAIVNFMPGPDAAFKTQNELEAALLRNKISFARRGPGLRFSPHAFNTEGDLERVFTVLEGRSAL